MSVASVGLAAGCALLAVEARFDATAEGLVEDLRLEVIDRGGCRWIELELPPGTVLGERRGRERRGDGTRVKLDDTRWEVSERRLDGSGTARLHLPDLLAGDRVKLRVERVHAPFDLAWTVPAADRVEVSVDGDVLEVAEGGTGPAELRIPAGGPAPRHDRLPAGDVRVEEHLTLRIPEGDPQLALFPGGGSSVLVQRYLVFPPAAEERGWPLDAPPGAEVRLDVQPEGLAAIESDPAAHRIVVAPSDAPARVTVSWEEPDAPAHGERDPEVAALVVSVDDGEILDDGRGWALVQVHGRPVIPDRATLVRALDRRFRYASMPEPGAPMELRGLDPSWELAAALRPTLSERAPIGAWPSDPLFPRRLQQARRSGALTPLEGTLVLWLYARQLKLDAEWALVRPASRGPGSALSPAGYTSPLLRITLDGETRWIDPTCAVCAPFELPPDLEDADALGPGTRRTGPSTRGRLDVVLDGDRVTWSAEGPPALLLRARLAELPTAERSRALAALVGGAGATLESVEGVEVAGAPIRAVVRRGEGLLPDPTTLPAPGADGSAWLEWIGPRTFTTAGEAPPLRREAGSATLDRTSTGGRTTVSLDVTSRLLPPADLAALSAPEPEPEVTRPETAPATP